MSGGQARSLGLPPELEEKIRSAREQLAAAERDLDTALSALAVVERSEKTMISKALQTAFDAVTTARTTLDDVDRAD